MQHTILLLPGSRMELEWQGIAEFFGKQVGGGGGAFRTKCAGEERYPPKRRAHSKTTGPCASSVWQEGSFGDQMEPGCQCCAVCLIPSTPPAKDELETFPMAVIHIVSKM